MKKRLYEKVEPLYSYANKKGKIYGYMIYGKNTTVHMIERLQGKGNYNGQTWEQLIMTVTFTDLKYGMTMKSKSTYHDEVLYVEYGQTLMEQDSLEEFYKNALLIATIHLQKTIKSMENLYEKYKKGEHCWPLHKGNVKEHIADIKRQKKVLSTIDVKQEDLKYINSFIEK